MKMGTASFEESATIYHIDLHDGIRSFERGGPAVTLAKKIGQVSHKLTFGLLNRHHIAGWGPQTDEHLAFAFVCTDAKKNQKLKATSVLQLRDGRGHTIAMDVEPNYAYEGGYGRKTFLNVTRDCTCQFSECTFPK